MLASRVFGGPLGRLSSTPGGVGSDGTRVLAVEITSSYISLWVIFSLFISLFFFPRLPYGRHGGDVHGSQKFLVAQCGFLFVFAQFESLVLQ